MIDITVPEHWRYVHLICSTTSRVIRVESKPDDMTLEEIFLMYSESAYWPEPMHKQVLFTFQVGATKNGELHEYGRRIYTHKEITPKDMLDYQFHRTEMVIVMDMQRDNMLWGCAISPLTVVKCEYAS